jgi:hypothetical protein
MPLAVLLSAAGATRLVYPAPLRTAAYARLLLQALLIACAIHVSPAAVTRTRGSA